MKANPIFDNLNLIRCLSCNNDEWKINQESILCKKCSLEYKKKGNKLVSTINYFREDKWEKKNSEFNPVNPSNPWINRIEGPKISSLREKFNIKGYSINLGSAQDSHQDFINIDLGNYKPVHLISDITNTPIKDSSIELIVSNSVLEHIFNYGLVIKEAHRMLKKGGFFYLCVPSVCPRHHQYDYHRWTNLGLRKLIEKDFEIIEQGVSRGIAHFIITYINQVIALKIKNAFIKNIIEFLWRIFSLPLFLIKDDTSEYNQALASTIYIIGKKR